MFPNKILQKVSKAEILQNARVGTAVHCLPEWQAPVWVLTGFACYSARKSRSYHAGFRKCSYTCCAGYSLFFIISRLSGSAAEFISIWNWMLFGKAPFGLDDDGLYLSLCPAIPARLLPEDGKLMGTFLGKVSVVYHAADLEELRPGAYRITGYQICDGTGTAFIADSKVPAEWAKQIRNGGVLRLEVSVEPI